MSVDCVRNRLCVLVNTDALVAVCFRLLFGEIVLHVRIMNCEKCALSDAEKKKFTLADYDKLLPAPEWKAAQKLGIPRPQSTLNKFKLVSLYQKKKKKK